MQRGDIRLFQLEFEYYPEFEDQQELQGGSIYHYALWIYEENKKIESSQKFHVGSLLMSFGILRAQFRHYAFSLELCRRVW